MNKLINSMSFYFLFPAYVALALLFGFFHVPEGYYPSLLSFYSVITLPILLITTMLPLRMKLGSYYQLMAAKPHYRFVILSACFFIVICGPLDIYVNGFKLLAPDTYADIFGVGRYIRHVTILCWLFVPVSFLFVRSFLMKSLFIGYALLFPILIIDRNRFILSCYSLFLCTMLAKSNSTENSKFKSDFLIFFIPILCLLIFSIVGHFRTGSEFVVPSSGGFLKSEYFPLKDSFSTLPRLLQQVVLYITTPIFNLATISSLDFINQDFLLSQFSPFSRESFDAYPYAPVLVPRFNVGTEFYPFLLYKGLGLVVFAFIGMLLSFIISFLLFKRSPNIFTFLIFIRISYNALFMGFAPQFYILLNLMFIILMLVLWFFAELIRASKLIEELQD
ncbi:hypothetical protein BN59_03127 [Legionella massiliensis]|uniref:Oligosaccharide repeat unit polymerase n=1 Tax=Legionella massiliensis TaxID=1034943 RepID=A0A078L4F5_9GAMM|nr:hypothetical protein [Legionella massiliensis]CDZ78813.1 hypothetical protein BN59_03127 [Legionella massiliensis]CEE14551.1 hypothetical protein BN1094_03127 [Legionella massiliensis]